MSWHRLQDPWAKAQKHHAHLAAARLAQVDKYFELELLNRHLAEQRAESVAGYYERALEKGPRHGRELIDNGRKTLDSLSRLDAERKASCKR